MKRIISSFTLLLSAVLLYTSCLNSDEEEVVYYKDTAITSFSLGTLNRYVKGTTKDGQRDSTYKSTVAGSKYKFYIDQAKCEIYNPDSLPVGTDDKHVICNISSKNNGFITIKNIDSDTLKYYSSTDSIDFSVPREVRIYPFSTDTTYYRKYTIRVNVHKEYADSFNWNLKGTNSEIAAMKKMKAVNVNDRIYVFGTDGDKTRIFSTEENNGNDWTALSTEFDADAYCNIAVKDSYIYIRCNDGKLKKSADAITWEDVAVVTFDRLIGAGTKKLYAFAGNNIMSSDDDGKTWIEDKKEVTNAVLPKDDICFNTLPLKTNKDAERVFITGYNTDENQWNIASIWSKIEEYSSNSESHSWIYYDDEAGNRYKLPVLKSMNVLTYDDKLIAMGYEPNADAYSTIYASEDNGLTWHSSNLYVYPKEFDTSATAITAVTDSSNHLWIICGGTGQIWYGRLNRLGWER